MTTVVHRAATVAVLSLGLTLGACGQSSNGGSAPVTQPTATVTVTSPSQPTSTGTSAPRTTGASPALGSSSSTREATSTRPPYGAPSTSSGNGRHVISLDGMGGLTIGSTPQELQTKDLVEPSTTCEKGWDVVNGRDEYQLAFDGGQLTGVWTKQRQATTPSGARIGMSFEQLQQLYGKKYKERPVAVGEGTKVFVAQVDDGIRALLFGAVDEHGEWSDIGNGSTVAWIATQPIGSAMVFGC